MIGELNSALMQKNAELNNLENRLAEICARLLGSEPPRDMKSPGNVAPVQAGLYEAAAQVQEVGNQIDRIRDHICRLEEL